MKIIHKHKRDIAYTMVYSAAMLGFCGILSSLGGIEFGFCGIFEGLARAAISAAAMVTFGSVASEMDKRMR